MVDVDEAGEVSLEFYPLECDSLEDAGRSISRTSRHWTRSIHSSRTPWKPCVSRKATDLSSAESDLTGSGPLLPGLGRVGAEKDLLSRVRDTVLKLEPFVYVEKIENLCQPELDFARRKQEGDLLGELLKISDGIREASSVRSELEGCLSELFRNPGMRKRLTY